jgi:hypothetical protein
MILSYPGGVGANWLVKVINQTPILSGRVNFHYDRSKNRSISLVHETDVTKFDYLYSGSSYFNFYINVLLKYFIHEARIFDSDQYATSFLTCVNTARYICKFEQINEHLFFNFDELVNAPAVFVTKVNQLQTKLGVGITGIEDFIKQRDIFISTCVNPLGVYENFDNMFWVCFVIGQLMNYDCVPTDFIISDPDNQDKCKKFAEQNYYRCKLNKVYMFDTKIHLPDLLNK